MFPSRRPAC